MITIRCPFCKKEYSDQKFVFHLVRSHKTTEIERVKLYCDIVFGEEETQRLVDKYRKGEICAYDLTRMGWKYQHIVDYIRLLGFKRSSSEERHTCRYKENYVASIQKRYGTQIRNVSQLKEVQKKKELTFAKTYGSYDNYCAAARKKMRIGLQNKWLTDPVFRNKMSDQMKGDNNVTRNPIVAKKISESKKLIYSSMTEEQRLNLISSARGALKDSIKKGCSKIEHKVWSALHSIGIEFDHNVIISGYNCDIVCSATKTIIEINGDYFHANPRKYSAERKMFTGRNGKPITAREIWNRDDKKKATLINSGFGFVVLWESEIRKCLTEESLINLINEKLTKENG